MESSGADLVVEHVRGCDRVDDTGNPIGGTVVTLHMGQLSRGIGCWAAAQPAR